MRSDQPSNLLTEAFLAGYTSLHEQYDIDIYTQRTTKLFVALKVLIKKQENLMVYGANFTQCVCTGYCESWILSLLSFIMNSWYHRAGGIGPAALVLAGSAFSQGKSNNSIFAKGK